MASKTIFLITGANRGIGYGLSAALLSQLDTTVIATVRSSDSSTDALKALSSAASSKLIIVTLSNASDTDAGDMLSTLFEQGITHIDNVIANAGSGSSFQSSLSTPLSELRENFEINTLGPIKLFQAINPLLAKSANPKFILISSSLGSIGDMEGNVPSLAYGVSKAAANYFVRKVHFECEELTAMAVHPGWVKTGNGQAFADEMGVEEPPMSLEESVKGVLKQIDGATRETTSGTFVSYDGTVISW